jgi:thioester reductase-like protein
MTRPDEAAVDIAALEGSDDRRELLLRALIKLRAAREDEARLREPLAVIGVGCRFPGGVHDAESFWQLLIAGRSAITEVPADRWDATRYFDADPDAPGHTYTQHAGLLEDLTGFDTAFFGIPPREARSLDPQQRLVLEVAWQALEHAGMAPDTLNGTRTGVFIGAARSDFERLVMPENKPGVLDGYAATGTSANFAANRLSYILGLEGPSLVVDTACSSSLVALHLATQSLRADECDLALVGGVNVLLSPLAFVALSKSRMLSPRGRCATFDAAADGYVRAEGCGVVVLRRQSLAIDLGEEVLAVVRGSATNQDGRSSGITVPNPAAQRRLIQSALSAAGVAAAEVGYVEAHGTGTALGDPIEVGALAQALGGDRTGNPVVLGSVKANIGHLEAGAGIAGLIKSILIVQRGVIPPQPGLTTLNPAVNWDELPVTVPVSATDWSGDRRVAGVSAFGFGGTNAHAIIQSAPSRPRAGPARRPAGPVAVKISAASAAGLRTAAANLDSFLRDRADVGLDEVAWMANTGRADLPERAAVIAETMADLCTGLRAIADDNADRLVVRGAPRGRNAPVAFIVPRAGDWLAGALAEWHRNVPAVTEHLEALAEVWGPLSRPPLSTLLTTGTETDSALVDSTVAAQALYAAVTALGAWWSSIGVMPEAVIASRGAGVWAAGALAGAFSLRHGAELIGVSKGPPDGSQPFGLPTVDLLLPGTPALSNAAASTPEYWLDQAGARTWGSDQDPAAACAQHRWICLGPDEPDVVPPVALFTSLGPDSAHQRLRRVAQLWADGLPVRWSRTQVRPTCSVKLPTYPFERVRHWAPDDISSGPSDPIDNESPLTMAFTTTAIGYLVGETQLSLLRIPFLAEHRVYGHLVVPGVVLIELALRALTRAAATPVALTRLALARPLALPDEGVRTIQVIVDPPTASGHRVRVFSWDENEKWHEHLQAVAESDLSAEPLQPRSDSPSTPSPHSEHWDHDRFYREAWHPSFTLGPSFSLIREARTEPGRASGWINPAPADALGIKAGVRAHLLLADACIQLVLAAAQHGTRPDRRQPVCLGTGFARLTVHRQNLATVVWCTANAHKQSGETIIGDLHIADDNGPIIDILEVSFRPVTPPMLQRVITTGTPTLQPPRATPGTDLVALRESTSPQRRQQLIHDHLLQLIASVLGSPISDVNYPLPLNRSLDSLMLTELQAMVQRDFGINMPLRTLFDDQHVSAVAEAINAILTATPEPADTPQNSTGEPEPMSVANMRHHAELASEITPRRGQITPHPVPPGMLLTGATGFVGTFLLAELLASTGDPVHCLVRAQDEHEARHRLLDQLDSHGIDMAAQHTRIVPVVGDLSAPQLGLTSDQFDELNHAVGSIIHCGATVNWACTYRQLEPSNVAGTREILRLATADRVLPVHFLSTVGVFSSPDYHGDPVSETEDLTNSGPLTIGYAQSKWIAEHMVRTAHGRGVPVTIHRINTGPHSRTTAFNPRDYFTILLAACIRHGIAPDHLDLSLQPATIDYVAQSIVAAATHPSLHGRTFHLVSADPVPWPDLFEWVRDRGYPLQQLPLTDWCQQIASNSGPIQSLAPILGNSDKHLTVPAFDSTRTRAVLEPLGLRCPPLTPQSVEFLLKRMAAKSLIDPPTISATHHQTTELAKNRNT